MTNDAATVPAPVSTAVPMARLGMWVFLAGEIIIFGGLITIYVLMRLAHPEWAEHAAHTMSYVGAVNTMALLTSSYTVVLAHQAADAGNHKNAARYLTYTVILGFLFLGVKSYEYSHELHAGYGPTTNLFWSFYYLMTSLHGLHVVGGMIAIAIIAKSARKGQGLHRVGPVGLYWHLVDVVWIFLFPLLYLAA